MYHFLTFKMTRVCNPTNQGINENKQLKSFKAIILKQYYGKNSV